jgi:hypothetical protein
MTAGDARRLGKPLLILMVATALAACSALESLLPGGESSDGTQIPAISNPPLPTYAKSPETPDRTSSWKMADCVSWEWQVDPIEGLEPLARISDAVVVGTFEGYGPGYWTTADGKRPSSEEFRHATYDITIVRNITFKVEQAIRGSAQDVDGAYVRGGVVGYDSISYSNMPELMLGSRLVLFLAPVRIGSTSSAAQQQVTSAWPVTDDGVATTDAGSPISLVDLERTVSTTPYSP